MSAILLTILDKVSYTETHIKLYIDQLMKMWSEAHGNLSLNVISLNSSGSLFTNSMFVAAQYNITTVNKKNLLCSFLWSPLVILSKVLWDDSLL